MSVTATDRPGRPTPLSRFVAVATAVEMTLAGLATVLIFVLVLVQAAQRYLPIDGWTWTGELARYCLVWLTFVAVGVLVTRDGHISLQIVDSIRSEPVLRTIRVAALLVVTATAVAFSVACWSLIQEQQNLKSPSLRLPMGWVSVLPLVGFLSTIVRSLAAALQIALHGVPDAPETESLALQVEGEERA